MFFLSRRWSQLALLMILLNHLALRIAFRWNLSIPFLSGDEDTPLLCFLISTISSVKDTGTSSDDSIPFVAAHWCPNRTRNPPQNSVQIVYFLFLRFWLGKLTTWRFSTTVYSESPLLNFTVFVHKQTILHFSMAALFFTVVMKSPYNASFCLVGCTKTNACCLIIPVLPFGAILSAQLG